MNSKLKTQNSKPFIWRIGIILSILWIISIVSVVFAGKAYIWHDKDGNVHFSDRPPAPEESGSEVEERHFKEAKPVEAAAPKVARSPIEHAVYSTFRLTNRKGGGSGFFINSTGLAVTANHVVMKATYSMRAELSGEKKKYRVRVLKKIPKKDLALIQVQIDRPTPYLEIRDMNTLVPGERLWAVGNPLLAFRETVTEGNFSRIFREEDWKREVKMKRPPFKIRADLVQFSAPIIGGNSGGPLVDQDGKVVGVVSLGLTGYKAINFAVPASYILTNFGSYLE